jgi:hypothetical protein
MGDEWTGFTLSEAQRPETLKALGCYGVGEYEKSGAIATDDVQAFNQ